MSVLVSVCVCAYERVCGVLCAGAWLMCVRLCEYVRVVRVLVYLKVRVLCMRDVSLLSHRYRKCSKRL